MKFHNGEPFTAESAKYTIERVADAKSKLVWVSRFDAVAGADVVDEYTLNVRTKAPFSLLPKTTFLAYILPAKYHKEKGDAFTNAPVGTGPFKFKEWKQDNYVTLEANPDYWDGAPKLKTITVRAYPEAATLVAALECDR